MAFDITSVLKGSGIGAGQEQITYLPLDQIDPDPNNFYSLDHLGELADNIATIGLQQPLRVRPGTEPGRYTIVSGHRRRAACLLIRDGEDEARTMFDNGVACIVETGEASEALQELRLIYANAATRVMTSAEMSIQAERVEMLLYQLKEEGMAFPGRMRDHVAEACKVSKSKLARLHAIRKRLDPKLLHYFDRGELNETTAYELQKLPAEAQKLIGERCEKRGSATWFYSWQVEKAAANTELYQNPKTGKTCGGNCTHKDARFLQALRSAYNPCDGGCCLNCGRMDYCEEPCARAEEKRKKNRADAKASQAEADRKRVEDQKHRQEYYRAARQAKAQRLIPLIEAAGLEDTDTLPTRYSWHKGPAVAEIRKYAAGDFGTETYYDDDLISDDFEVYMQLADILDCSLDYLAGRSDEPKTATVSGPNTAPQWQTGTPTEIGDYTVRSGIPDEEGPKTSTYRIVQWDGERWAWIGTGVPMADNVYRWVKLPEV